VPDSGPTSQMGLHNRPPPVGSRSTTNSDRQSPGWANYPSRAVTGMRRTHGPGHHRRRRTPTVGRLRRFYLLKLTGAHGRRKSNAIPIAALSYLPAPSATTHACRPDCNIHVFRARRQSASACRRRQCRRRVDKGPCDKTTERNYPKSALCLVAIECAATSFLHGERTCADAPCLVSTTFARSHVGAMTLNGGLLHFCAILMMRRRYSLKITEQEHNICVRCLQRCDFESLRA